MGDLVALSSLRFSHRRLSSCRRRRRPAIVVHESARRDRPNQLRQNPGWQAIYASSRFHLTNDFDRSSLSSLFFIRLIALSSLAVHGSIRLFYKGEST
ncbi:hypothetical protein MUK42_35899 [Musa troglodytarum]|uniref:Uncharacterized protein n=1 Tax=Musa troglodytarum TaxID=320322 RepID=A0A9E7JS98_9LILI|nr:hypothetical protein MUK42_35899 [Musa troglodytarum]